MAQGSGWPCQKRGRGEECASARRDRVPISTRLDALLASGSLISESDLANILSLGRCHFFRLVLGTQSLMRLFAWLGL